MNKNVKFIHRKYASYVNIRRLGVLDTHFRKKVVTRSNECGSWYVWPKLAKVRYNLHERQREDELL